MCALSSAVSFLFAAARGSNTHAVFRIPFFFFFTIRVRWERRCVCAEDHDRWRQQQVLRSVRYRVPTGWYVFCSLRRRRHLVNRFTRAFGTLITISYNYAVLIVVIGYRHCRHHRLLSTVVRFDINDSLVVCRLLTLIRLSPTWICWTFRDSIPTR